MVGTNVLRLNHETACAAFQMYLDSLSMAPLGKVTCVDTANDHGFRQFVVDVDSTPRPPASEITPGPGSLPG